MCLVKLSQYDNRAQHGPLTIRKCMIVSQRVDSHLQHSTEAVVMRRFGCWTCGTQQLWANCDAMNLWKKMFPLLVGISWKTAVTFRHNPFHVSNTIVKMHGHVQQTLVHYSTPHVFPAFPFSSLWLWDDKPAKRPHPKWLVASPHTAPGLGTVSLMDMLASIAAFCCSAGPAAVCTVILALCLSELKYMGNVHHMPKLFT